jgi:protein-S-isoprenylcysteine O-methyltransferase Ste14
VDREGIRWTALGFLFIGTFAAGALLVGALLGEILPLFLVPSLRRAAIPGILLAAAGFGLVAWATSAFGRFGHGTPLPLYPPKRLVTQGPYRHIRNPIYVGWFTAWGGVTLLTGNLTYAGMGAVLLVAGSAYAAHGERPALAGRFGPEFERWVRETPAFLPRRRA